MISFFRALQFHANVMQGIRRPEVEHIVISLLQENMNLQFIKNKFLHSFRSIRKAQGTFRDYINRKEGFKLCMNILWEKNYEKVYDEVINPISPIGTSKDRKP